MISSNETAAQMQRYAHGHAINAALSADRARRPIFGSPSERRQAELEAAQLQETAAFTAHVARLCTGAVEDEPATEAEPVWRLLTRADTIQAGDEGLNDDCETWHPVVRFVQRMPYNPGFFVPIRRRVTSEI